MTGADGNMGVERRASAKAMRYMLAYIVIGQFFVQLDRTNIGFAQLTMGTELSIAATAFGFAAGIFALAGFSAQLPAGWMFERFGARRWLTSTMIAWGLIVVCQAFVTSRVELFVLRFLLGGLEAGFAPGIYVLISQWFKGTNHGKVIAGLQIGAASSGILGAPFAGWVLGHTVLSLSGWRSLFFVEGGLTVVWAIIALRILYDSPAEAPWLDADERRFLTKDLAQYQAHKIQGGAIEKATIWEAMKDFRIIALMLAYTCAGWVSATFAFFMPTLLKTAGGGMDNQTVGLVAIGPYLIMGIVALTWGAHADRTERHWHCVIPLLISALGISIYPYASTTLLAMFSLALVQAGSTGFFVTFWPTCHMIVGKETVSRTTALINSGTQFGSFVAPIFFGWAKDTTGKNTFGLYVCIGILLLNFVIMNAFFFNHKARQKALANVPSAV